MHAISDKSLIDALSELLSVIRHDDESASFVIDEIKIQLYADGRSTPYFKVSAHNINGEPYKYAMYVYEAQIIADGF